MAEEAKRGRWQSDLSADSEDLVKVLQQLVDAFDALPDGVALFDPEDRFLMWNRRYAEIYAPIADSIAVGVPFEHAVRAALKKGLILDAVDREDEWLAKRLAGHRQASQTFEHNMTGGRWVRSQDRRTSTGGVVSVRGSILFS